jgi:phosphoglycolate phosphatase
LSGPFRAVLFDLDGTLADTLSAIAGVANFALAHLGLPVHPLDAYRRFVGDGIGLLAERALPAGALARAPSLREQLLAVMRDRYATHVLDGVRLYDGIAETLAALAARGAALGVLSNKPDDLTRATMDGLGISSRFRAIRGQRDGVARKPDPAAALELARELGAAPHELLYVGDTATDMETARNARFPSVGVLWGFRDRAELETAGARWIVTHPRELLSIWDGERDSARGDVARNG